jgi:hypothetical protein
MVPDSDENNMRRLPEVRKSSDWPDRNPFEYQSKDGLNGHGSGSRKEDLVCTDEDY